VNKRGIELGLVSQRQVNHQFQANLENLRQSETMSHKKKKKRKERKRKEIGRITSHERKLGKENDTS
jgi:hypothetical protein